MSTIGYSQPPAVAAQAPAHYDRYVAQRSPAIILPYALAGLIGGVSWVGDGIPILTDFAFIIMTLASAVLLLNETILFPQRFGMGGLVLFGGVLTWFSWDYFANWIGYDFSTGYVFVPAVVVAKGACLHGIGLAAICAGLLIPWGAALERLTMRLPEPTTMRFYFWVCIGLFLMGLSPYFLLTNDPWYVAIYQEIVGGRYAGASWQVTRSDNNLNYNWGAYFVILIQMGKIGALLGLTYAMFWTRSIWRIAVCALIWLFWTLLAFGSGTRGETVFMMLPLALLLFMKYQAISGWLGQHKLVRAYVLSGAVLVLIAATVQVQSRFRNMGFLAADLETVEWVNLEGNTMFSEALPGLAAIPGQVGFFQDEFPGDRFISPIPRLMVTFAIGPIPRALWRDKPIDRLWLWYNQEVAGNDTSTGAGTTISRGLIGDPYMRYGIPGVLQYGLLCGWFIGFSERLLQNARGRSLVILTSLLLLTWAFRSFRGINFNEIYPGLIGIAMLASLAYTQRLFSGAGPGARA